MIKIIKPKDVTPYQPKDPIDGFFHDSLSFKAEKKDTQNKAWRSLERLNQIRSRI